MVTTRSGGAKITSFENVQPKRTPKRKKPASRREHIEPSPNLLEHVELYIESLQEKAPTIVLLPQETKVSLSLWETFEISKASKASSSETEDFSRLHLCYAGGEVWACDTLIADSKLYLALSAYRKDSLVHSIYEKYSNPGLIQIWKYDACGDEKPVCILCIGHEGDFCRQLRWLPACFSEVDKDDQHILGFLLGCFGDGSLKVIRVTYNPVWKQENSRYPIFVPSDVLFSFSSPCEANLVASECSSDGRWIIGGDTKGNVHLWNLKEKQSNVFMSEQRDKIYYQSFPAHQVTIRSLATPRAQLEMTHIEYPNKMSVPTSELLASGSMDGCIRIWMLNFPYRPLLEYRLGQSWIYQLEWHSTKELIAALDDGSVRLLPIEESNKSTRVLALHQGACWCVSISYQDEGQPKPKFSVSSGGENGEWIYCNDSLWASRKNKKLSTHPWRLAKVEMFSCKSEQDDKASPQPDEGSVRYSLSTFISERNIPEVAQYIQRPLSTYIPFPPSIAFHRVFHHFLPRDRKDTLPYSLLLGATFGKGWFLLGTMSSWLVQQL